ncbi:hypothetical protein [Allonocardiopsis opalescens]|uniref:Uncharacterized protein n=1 Tax=Allonocardiopsis opalescens TaxID=1144618 RepID=A0A2T0Q2V5_9ACTN|nr:hypothetical protein [Allonocardiopsis opalescens]PRX98124.1 hypothetical protein CLV72_105477 [Allonocardiopsis opalescens]
MKRDNASIVDVYVLTEDSAKRVAPGILVAPSAVIVPDPPRELLDRSEGMTVRTLPEVPDRAEKLLVEKVEAARFEGGFVSSFCALYLRDASAYAVQVPAAGRGALAEAIERHEGDLWEVFAELGYLVAGRPRYEGPQEWEWPEGLVADSFAEFVIQTCRPTPICKGGPGDGE